jgi:transcriptional regulator with XRE-family HTH domain
MSFNLRLKAARKDAGVKATAIANEFGISVQSVYDWERGESKPELDKLPVLARLVGRSIDWLLSDDEHLSSEDIAAGLPPQTLKRRIKVKGYVGAGGQAIPYNVDQGDFDEIDATSRDGKDAVAVRIVGSSMGVLFNGWYAVYDDVRRPVTDDLIGKGKICVVGLADGRVLVKQIERAGRGRFNLISETEPPIKNVEIEWAAQVTDIRSP